MNNYYQSHFWYQLNNPQLDQPDTAIVGGGPQKLILLFGFYDPSSTKSTTTLTPPSGYQSLADAIKYGATGSQFYLNLSPFNLSHDEFTTLFQNMVADNTSWTFHIDDSSSQIIYFAPTKKIIVSESSPPGLNKGYLDVGQPLSIVLNNVTLSTLKPSPPPLKIEVDYFLATPEQIQGHKNKYDITATIRETLEAAPSPGEKNLRDMLRITIEPDLLIVTPPSDIIPPNVKSDPCYNTPLLKFSPVQYSSSLMSGDATRPTYFRLRFIVGELTDADAFVDLLTSDQILSGQPTVEVSEGASGWTISPPDKASYSWTLTPPVSTDLFGSNGLYSPTFNITRLLTQFPPGPTLAWLDCYNVPGYPDTTYVLSLQKAPHAQIDNFSVIQQTNYLNGQNNLYGTLQVAASLSWRASLYTTLTLNPGQTDVTDTPQVTDWNLDGQTGPFSLRAEGQSPDNSVPNLATGTVTVDNFAMTPDSAFIFCPSPEALNHNICVAYFDPDNPKGDVSNPLPLSPAFTGDAPALTNPRAVSFNNYLYVFDVSENNEVIYILYDQNNKTSQQSTIGNLQVKPGGVVTPFRWRQQLYIAFPSDDNTLSCARLVGNRSLSADKTVWTMAIENGAGNEFGVWSPSDQDENMMTVWRADIPAYIFGSSNDTLKLWEFVADNNHFTSPSLSDTNKKPLPLGIRESRYYNALKENPIPCKQTINAEAFFYFNPLAPFVLTLFYIGLDGKLYIYAVKSDAYYSYTHVENVPRPINAIPALSTPFVKVLANDNNGNIKMLAVYVDESNTFSSAVLNFNIANDGGKYNNVTLDESSIQPRQLGIPANNHSIPPVIKF